MPGEPSTSIIAAIVKYAEEQSLILKALAEDIDCQYKDAPVLKKTSLKSN